MTPVDKCHFCPTSAPGMWAMTACKGDPKDTASWSREILPACYRCSRLFSDAGDKGLKLKATGERWYGGHTMGRFEPPQSDGYP